MNATKQVAVIIPFYKTGITAYEAVALEQCFMVLNNYDVIAIKPQQLQLPAKVTKYPFFKTVDFADEYFNGIRGYNRLMLDAIFYEAFLSYEYILIYQLDAFVFTDELSAWCMRGFDYIGAPWIRPVKQGFIKSIKNHIQNYIHVRYNIKKDGLPHPKQLINRVGNGGFSLRRTKVFYELSKKYRNLIEAYNAHDSHYFNEDVFWSIEINRKCKILNIPYYKTALKFAFEFHPAQAFIMNNQTLPFGCHSWDRNINFWEPIFKEYGYTIK
jgi:hypothetical protein